MGVGFTDEAPNGSYIYTDDLTWIRGKHSFRFGYQYSRYFYNDKSLSDAGSFTFGPRQTDLPGFVGSTGHSFASFLLGGVLSATHGVTPFSQDSASLSTPSMPLTTGSLLQADGKCRTTMGNHSSVYEVTGRMSEIGLNTANPGADGRLGALVFANGGSRFGDHLLERIRTALGLGLPGQ